MIMCSVPDYEAQASKALAQAMHGDIDAALEHLKGCESAGPDAYPLLRTAGIIRGLRGEFAFALAALRASLEVAPGDVLARAYLGAFLFGEGEERKAAEVLDFDSSIFAGTLGEMPDRDLASLNSDLTALVRSHPTLQWEMSSKSTRGGWQTGEIFTGTDDPLVRLKRLLGVRVREFLKELDGDSGAGGVAPFDLTGWGVILRDGGYQQPHVHRRGILSGVYYTSIPASVANGDGGRLRFCRNLPWIPQARPACAAAVRDVVPAQGKVVIFPSYFWHQTVPFHGEGERVCISFDVIPPAH